MARSIRLAAPLFVALSMPAVAQDDDDGLREGLDLFAEGSRIILDSLLDEIEPDFETDIAPMIEGLADRLGEMSGYHPPEILPNGDILIRRRETPAPGAAPGPDDGGEGNGNAAPDGDNDGAPVTDPVDL